MRLLRIVLLCGLLAAPAMPGRGQDQDPSEEPNYEFVSGTVTELLSDRIVVNRAVLGKPAENRTFLITEETKIEGKLKVNARVTVGFKTSEGVDIAMRIIVRNSHSDGKKNP